MGRWPDLVALCQAKGVEWNYTDGTGERREAPVETVLASLSAMGAAVRVPEDAAEALRAHQDLGPEKDPVVVAFPGLGTLEGAWGLFAPLVSLRSQAMVRSGGATLTTLGELAGWVSGRGGQVISTLPLLAGFERSPAEPSPYRPYSRSFFHGRWLDLEKIPEFASCSRAQALVRGGATAEALAESAGQEFDQVEAVCAARRPILEALAAHLWEAAPERVEGFLAREPEVLDYAVFRGTQVAHGRDWKRWPEDAEAHPGEVRLRVAEQLWMKEQLQGLADGPAVLGLDLPVGVHPEGYDAWRDRDSVAVGMELGAPPDAHFPSGQCWELPALVPEMERDCGYRSMRRALAAHCAHAGLLRIDHALGLHRRFWVPTGGSAAEGVYVRWPAHTLYTLLALEAARTNTVMYFEDLGCEPGDLRDQMERTRALGMVTAQGEMEDPRGPVSACPARCVASLNTHDMPPWAAFCVAQGVQPSGALRDAVLAGLGRSPAGLVLVSLADVLGERESFNVPGTSGGTNWRRRAAATLEGIRGDATAGGVLDGLQAARLAGTE